MEDIFGRPREGIHSARIPYIDLAAVDVILTFLGACFIGWKWEYNILFVFLVLMLLSIPIHMAAGSRTALIDKLF